jgi:hypothetical protein
LQQNQIKMKQLIIILFLFTASTLLLKTPCDYSENISDSIGTYKSTREYMISEKNFAGNSSYIFYSLALTDLPTLNIQLIQKQRIFESKLF